MKRYFKVLQSEVDRCYSIAEQAREKGLDPETKVEIPQARDLAARVEELVGPKGIASRIRRLTDELGDREMVSIEIAKEIASGKKYRFSRVEDAVDQAIRTGLAILTEGVLVAPLEGIAEVRIGRNRDGSNYVDLYFSGPIRSAGGTGQAMSVLIADIVRRELGIGRFIPTKGEIERYKEEIPLYKRVQHLQYLPTVDEIEAIASNCPVCINGEGTEDEEVTGYRDLPRVETNRLRGGACLVMAEGLCLKAPKILKHVSRLKIEGWEFLEQFVKKKNGEEDKQAGDVPTIEPSSKYIGDVIAGRPVLSHPSRKGGFRLRYGRGRTCGLASTAIHPATMYILDEFIAVGTQMKTERPGKGTIGTPCDSIEGPIVLLKNGDLIQVNGVEEANLVRDEVSKIIDLGEILVPFGEFMENNTLLSDASYVYEWWIQELQKKLDCLPEKNTFDEIEKSDKAVKEKVNQDFNREIDLQKPSPRDAFALSEKYDVPLHPFYNLFWHDVSKNDVENLAVYILENGEVSLNDGNIVLRLPKNSGIKDILIELGTLHRERNGKLLIERYAYPLIRCCGLDVDDEKIVETARFSKFKSLMDDEKTDTMMLVSTLSGVTIRKRAPSRIGARMGRPEKASPRKMRPPPHVLFPVGNFGGNQRLITDAAEKEMIEVEAGVRKCENCGRNTFKIRCDCGGHTVATGKVELQKINLRDELQKAQRNVGVRTLPDKIKGVIGTISKDKTPEPLEKGILRAKHDVFVFKDGTTRFDMTDAPLTHFKPSEVGVTIEKLRELGYTHDWQGNELEKNDQICELKVQDVIISRSCGNYLLNVSRFVDELLEKFYGLQGFYDAENVDDLVGHLVVGLAPHTSGGVVGRIIGFTDAQVGFAHPFYHAAKRRNCDGDEDAVMLLLDALLNFSHSYIPDKRGGKMDLPLLVTTRIDPREVDKEAHNIDGTCRYPLAFYETTVLHKNPKDVESLMDLVASRLGSPLQYEKIGFTHDTSDISGGPTVSSYKTLKTMMDKIDAQLRLAMLIRAVDDADVACKVLERHFLPDLLGNLRAFSKQTIRCPLCNTVYRRVPLKGVCPKCGGKLTLTVHKKSVEKYLNISKELSERYDLPDYLKQRITLIEKSIQSLFTNDKVKIKKLSDFF
ncbi:MAG: DNA polymerase II large subunit [Thermoplasmata archaeon]|nr:DNA polymerase II large subunit [Thermoplasmata archaeon]